ncbi:H-NS histone family protein [Burkholderia seminalis]|uniref:H-NS histone family protein n=1 Tax=Burkholderia seminalis TaxID=488731 RepID=UPI0014545832|nr:H-NS histone family protein [Burkholderia seminalis]MCA8306871.1 H-NS histone family protein [Burkholderia seminalis]MCA8435479.1 H-NS histone family protein [Burkholderia seminalis]VWC42938.1 HNS-like protein [Burkholderia seminalis]
MEKYLELINQQQQLHEKISETRRNDIEEILAGIVRTMLTYEISLEEIKRALAEQCRSSTRPKRVAKYMDPVTGCTWSGRGRRPNWMKGAADIEQFRLPE